MCPSTIGLDRRATQSREVTINGERIYTTVTASPETAEWWIEKIKHTHNTTGYRLIVGFDIELVSVRYRVATIQFSAGEECLIFRTSFPSPLPVPLQQFLLDQNNVFVGVDLRKRLRILKQQARIREDYVPYVELRNLAAYSYSSSKLNKAGLVKLAEVVLSLNIVRSELRRRWNEDELSDADVEHACTGAYIALQIGLVLTRPMRKLRTHLESQSELAGIVPYANLGHLAAFHCNRPELLDAEMSELALNVLGKKLYADCDQPELLDEQVMCACIGAYELGRETLVI